MTKVYFKFKDRLKVVDMLMSEAYSFKYDWLRDRETAVIEVPAKASHIHGCLKSIGVEYEIRD